MIFLYLSTPFRSELFTSKLEMSRRLTYQAFKMRKIEDDWSFDEDATQTLELISVVLIIFLFWIFVASLMFPEGGYEVNGAIFG